MCLFSSHRSLPLQLHSAAAQEKLEETARGRTVAKLLVQCDEGSSSWESLDLWDCSLAKKWQCIQSIQSPHNPFCFLIDAVASGKVARSATGELESMWTSSTTFDAMPYIWAFKDSGIIWDTSSLLTKLVLLSQIGCQIGSLESRSQEAVLTRNRYIYIYIYSYFQMARVFSHLPTTWSLVIFNRVRKLLTHSFRSARVILDDNEEKGVTTISPPEKDRDNIREMLGFSIGLMQWLTSLLQLGKKNFGGFNDLYIFCCITV